MADKALATQITGDIAATADVTINTKGGSTTATLKKALREPLGDLSGHMTGATLEFASGQAVVLLAGASTGAPLRVRKTGRNRFEIESEVDGDVEVDAVTAAFLRLMEDQLKKGQLRLSKPMSAAEWRRKNDAEYAEARKLLASKGVK